MPSFSKLQKAQENELDIKRLGLIGISLSGHFRHGKPCVELCSEQDIGVAKHTIFERHNYELALFEVLLDDFPDVLRVGQVQSGIHLQNANNAGNGFIKPGAPDRTYRSWFFEKKGRDQNISLKIEQ